MHDAFKENLLSLQTSQFGTVAELIIKCIKKLKDKEIRDSSYDLVDGRLRVEVKASKVFKKNTLKCSVENMYKLIVNNSNRNRLMSKSDVEKHTFDCNIQQIKIDCFDVMYYLLFFYDCIEVFKIESETIKNNQSLLRYSNKQHRGNIGEGQFHINNNTYSHHIKKYLDSSFTYNQIGDLFSKKDS